jgi:hypothetical protein
MHVKLRQIEVDADTAEALEAQAAARGITVQELLAELAGASPDLPDDLEALRASGRGPWAPEILAEDARRLAEFNRTGEGVPWDEVRVWMQSWGKSHELPRPKPRKL